MTLSPKGTALITSASSGVGVVHHICSIALNLFEVLPATAQRSGIPGTTNDVIWNP